MQSGLPAVKERRKAGKDMKKDFSVLFDPRDFLMRVTFMGMEERGQLITLLCLQRTHGHLTEKDIRTAVGGALSSDVLANFEIDETGRRFNRRLDEEIARQSVRSEKQRKRAEKRWRKQGEKQRQEQTQG